MVFDRKIQLALYTVNECQRWSQKDIERTPLIRLCLIWTSLIIEELLYRVGRRRFSSFQFVRKILL